MYFLNRCLCFSVQSRVDVQFNFCCLITEQRATQTRHRSGAVCLPESNHWCHVHYMCRHRPGLSPYSEKQRTRCWIDCRKSSAHGSLQVLWITTPAAMKWLTRKLYGLCRLSIQSSAVTPDLRRTVGLTTDTLEARCSNKKTNKRALNLQVRGFVPGWCGIWLKLVKIRTKKSNH